MCGRPRAGKSFSRQKRNEPPVATKNYFGLRQPMSDPAGQNVRMQSDERAGSLEWNAQQVRELFSEWEKTAAEISVVLHEQAKREPQANWRPHLEQMDHALRSYRELCRAEAEQLGQWRADELQQEEIYEAVWEQGDRLTQWLLRMLRD